MNTLERIKKFCNPNHKLPITEEDIEKECKRLNITSYCSNEAKGMDKVELQRRIIAARSDSRNSWLFLLTILSAAASIISALAAFIAVAKHL